MFSNLFDEETPLYEAQQATSNGKGGGLARPPAPRGSTNLCGLSNLGATCYLNSLLQTLHFTPEFREALFSLDERELGVFSEAEGADNSMVRVIPIQLQKLFARLLLLNQQSAGVESLTTSFGWSNTEEFQQHDVQELNRILFSAIESSLCGTSGHNLIARLYHGISVQQITCKSCGRVSEREEEFLDIPVALTGQAGLEAALKEMYIAKELLEGPNQYHCSSCKTLVDASRGCHLRKLPPILTFALLRFLYDFEKGERYKDTSKFHFPMELDMSPYCGEKSAAEVEEEGEVDRAVYELFSVVIHSGSTHSGHYTAYIRDVDNLGSWKHPEEEPVQLPADPATGTTDLIDYENPADLLKALLLQQLGGSASVNKLCKTIQQQTGVTWNKRFKKQFGPINQFLKACTDLFTVSDTNQVSLVGTASTAQTESTVITGQDLLEPSATNRPPSLESGKTKEAADLAAGETQPTVAAEPSTIEPTTTSVLDTDSRVGSGIGASESPPLPPPPSCSSLGESVESQGAVGSGSMADCRGSSSAGEQGEGKPKCAGKAPSPPQPSPPAGQRWFQFNDVYVSPMVAKAIEKMFQGKQSAYMLFYRRKRDTLSRPPEAQSNPLYGLPERLQVEVAGENSKLEEDRAKYEVAVNTVRINVHFSSEYSFENGALAKVTELEPFVVSIDRRKPVADLLEMITELKRAESGMVVHTAKSLPSGLHLYDCISDGEQGLISEAGLTSESNLFVWDGQQVRGEVVQTGASCEPVRLHVTYPPPPSGNGGEPGDSGEESELVAGFAKNSTLGELRWLLGNLLGVHGGHVTINQVKVVERSGRTTVELLSPIKDKCTLEELGLRDGHRLAAETKIKKGMKTLAHSVADKQSKMLSLILEDRCTVATAAGSFPVHPLEVSKDELISALKRTALLKIGARDVEGGGRVRVDDDSTGLGPPLHEEQTVTDAGMTQGQRIVVEPGHAPLNSELALECMLATGGEVREVIVERVVTVSECCRVMARELNLEGDAWHLRRTNWCGEATEILDDETVTLEKERLKSGDRLLLEVGKLPPKGYIRLPVFLYSAESTSPSHPPHSEERGEGGEGGEGGDDVEMSVQQPGMDDIPPSQDEVPLHLRPPAQYYPPVSGELVEIGTLEVSKDCSVHELKLSILTLPSLLDASVPTTDFLRVRELSNGRPGKVFKQSQHSLRRLKLTSDSRVCCSLLPHPENLESTSIVFSVCLRIPGERKYGPLREVVYDTAQSTAPHSLVAHVSELVGLPPERVRLAKLKLESFEWIRIQDSYLASGGAGAKKGRKKGRGSSSKVNIKNSPILLRDGDIVGIKDLQYDPDDSDDFSTPNDDKGKAILTAVQDEKRKRRRTKDGTDIFGSSGQKRQRRPEVGIRIFVPDYQTSTTIN